MVTTNGYISFEELSPAVAAQSKAMRDEKEKNARAQRLIDRYETALNAIAQAAQQYPADFPIQTAGRIAFNALTADDE